jgi:hypothetical protein
MGPFRGRSSNTVLNWSEDLLRYVMDDGLMASKGGMFDQARFGRDSAYCAWAIMDMPQYQPIVDRAIYSFAATVAEQPQVDNWRTDASYPGQTFHENRRRVINGKAVNRRSRAIIDQLSADWGGDASGFTTYFSADATALAIITILERCKRLGSGWRDYLNQMIPHELNGGERRLIDVLLLKLGWLAFMLRTDDNGLLSSRRRNPHGHFYPWRHDENKGAYLHTRGEAIGQLGNGNGPLASSEGQAQAHRALRLGIEVLGGEFPKLASEWASLADHLRRQTIKLLWLNDLGPYGFFAQGLDRDPETQAYRPIANIASNTLEMMGAFFDGLPEEERRHYLTGMLKTMWYELMTDAGVRSMWTEAQKLLPCYFYWGPTSVWMIDNFLAQRGMLHSGQATPRLVEQHIHRSMNPINVATKALENMAVMLDGRVIFDPRATRHVQKPRIPFLVTDQPNGDQAWTLYSVGWMDTVLPTLKEQRAPEAWLQDLEDEILATTPSVDLLQTSKELKQAFEAGAHVNIDIERARHLQETWAGFMGQDPRKLEAMTS